MKSRMKFSLALWIVMVIVSACSQGSKTPSVAVNRAITRSLFIQGESVPPGNFSSLTDGGYIAPPDQTTQSTAGGNDGGYIATPGDLNPTGSSDGGSLTQQTGGGTSSGSSDNGSLTQQTGGGTSSGSSDNGNLTQQTGGGTSSGSSDNGSLTQQTGGGTSSGSSDNGSLTQQTGGGTSSGSSDNGSLTQQTGGGTSSGGGGTSVSHSDCGCHSTKPKTKVVKIEIQRFCSIRRSNGKSLFFEDAKNPILSVETVKGSKILSLASISLKGVDLRKEKHIDEVTIELDKLQKSKPLLWRSNYLSIKVCEDSDRDGFCFDEPQQNNLVFEVPEFKAGSIPKSIQLGVWSGRYLSKNKNPESCEMQYSPLVFDLKGDGFKLAGPEAGIFFDMNDTGEEIPTGWIGSSDDAFLVRDLNGNRKIDSGAELFGNATRFPSGAQANNGFEALKALDSNYDGVISSQDTAWRELKLWIDINFDGVSQSRELINLDRAGIQSISLSYVDVLEIDSFGNQTRERSTFVRKVGRKEYVLPVADVWFNSFVLEK